MDLLADLDLARRLERHHALATFDCADALGRRRPDLGGAAEEVAGGIAVFAGPGSPMTQAAGVGLDGPVSDAEFDRLERFYFDRNATCRIEFCPLADPSLMQALGRCGYRPVEFANVLYRPLDPDEPAPALPLGVVVREAAVTEAATYAEVLMRGFGDDGPPAPDLLELGVATFDAASIRPYLALVEGEPAAGGALFATADGVATLAGASTRPRYRRRGLHAAIHQARLHDAAREGCTLAAVHALPGSTSQRNAERKGFRIAYTRISFERDPS